MSQRSQASILRNLAIAMKVEKMMRMSEKAAASTAAVAAAMEAVQSQMSPQASANILQAAANTPRRQEVFLPTRANRKQDAKILTQDQARNWETKSKYRWQYALLSKRTTPFYDAGLLVEQPPHSCHYAPSCLTPIQRAAFKKEKVKRLAAQQKIEEEEKVVLNKYLAEVELHQEDPVKYLMPAKPVPDRKKCTVVLTEDDVDQVIGDDGATVGAVALQDDSTKSKDPRDVHHPCNIKENCFAVNGRKGMCAKTLAFQHCGVGHIRANMRKEQRAANQPQCLMECDALYHCILVELDDGRHISTFDPVTDKCLILTWVGQEDGLLKEAPEHYPEAIEDWQKYHGDGYKGKAAYFERREEQEEDAIGKGKQNEVCDLRRSTTDVLMDTLKDGFEDAVTTEMVQVQTGKKTLFESLDTLRVGAGSALTDSSKSYEASRKQVLSNRDKAILRNEGKRGKGPRTGDE